MNYLERAAFSGDVWGRLSILNHYVCLFQADGQPNLCTGVRQMIIQSLQISFSMQHQYCTIRKKHFADEDLHYLWSGTQVSDVEWLSISSDMEVDALSTVCEKCIEGAWRKIS